MGYPGEILYDIHYDELMMASSVGAFGVRGKLGQNTSIRAGSSRRSSTLSAWATSRGLMIRYAGQIPENALPQVRDLRGRRLETQTKTMGDHTWLVTIAGGAKLHGTVLVSLATRESTRSRMVTLP